MFTYDTLTYTKELPGGFQTNKRDEFHFSVFGCQHSSYEISRTGELVLVADMTNGMHVAAHVNFSGSVVVQGGGNKYLFVFEKQYLKSIELDKRS
jgi:hypothetical protein